MLSYALTAARTLQPQRVVVVVGHEAEQVRQAFPAVPDRDWVYQIPPLGTGDAVRRTRQALRDFSGDLLILSGDVPFISRSTLVKVLETHRTGACDLTLTVASLEDPTGYGRVLRNGDGKITGVVEHRDATASQRQIREINVGLYAVSSGFLYPALEQLPNDNEQGEYYLPDIVQIAARAKKRIGSVAIEDAREFRGINDREELAWMEQSLRKEINRKWMAAGVTLKDPDTTYIDAEVIIGRDTVIGPNSHLLGKTVLGERCRVDGSAYLTDCRLGDDVHLRFSVVMTGCEVENAVSVGPFAHLRPGTSLGPRVHIGNFVEVKNTRVGEATKASHLSYLGDAEIGSESNIGAGTITCNYNGFEKHRTTIGDRVQVGSDTQLLAPVVVEDDVYIGAGSTITKNVPSGALAISRVAQQHVEGWVANFRKKHAKP